MPEYTELPSQQQHKNAWIPLFLLNHDQSARQGLKQRSWQWGCRWPLFTQHNTADHKLSHPPSTSKGVWEPTNKGFPRASTSQGDTNDTSWLNCSHTKNPFQFWQDYKTTTPPTPPTPCHGTEYYNIRLPVCKGVLKNESYDSYESRPIDRLLTRQHLTLGV